MLRCVLYSQILYRVTILSLVFMSKNEGEVTLLDVDGSKHQLTTHHVTNILLISWSLFLISLICNGIYYVVNTILIEIMQKLSQLINIYL